MQQTLRPRFNPFRSRGGFSLVELLTVIAIISILMTVGAIGIGGITGGKGVTNGVATAEALFEEARGLAVSKRTNARVLIARNLTGAPENNLRLVAVAYQKTDPDTGELESGWELSGRGSVLPDQVFFSQDYSKKSHQGDSGQLDTESFTDFSQAYNGEYFYYEFNSEGICKTPGASFVIGSGARPPNATAETKPRVVGSAKKDFGGFVIWRNGRTSLFRSPTQIGISDTSKEF